MAGETYYKEGDCTICEKWFPLLHWHHTVPRALGGENSKQIPLCAQCHNNLHAAGLAVVASRNHGQKSKKNYWTTATMETNAAPYLEILVDAILSADDVRGKLYVMQFGAPPALHNALQLYKLDSKVTSLEKAIVLALSEHLRHRGYLIDGQHSKGNERKGKGSQPGSLANLW